jgi:diadenosine tetraphosphate (Ap4A) HIT family hydrolase
MTCSLCESLRSEAFRLIRRNEQVAAMIIREPQIPFHALVLPLRHVTQLAELDATESRSLHTLVEQLTRRMDEVLGCATIAAINGARYRTQGHLHYQILPLDAGLRTLVASHLQVPERQILPERALESMAGRIRW